jgi:hypothetical protein
VRLVLTEERADPASDRGFRYRVPDSTRMLIAAAGAEGLADTERLESIGYVSPSLLDHRFELSDGLIEPLTLFLLGALDRQPLHAAAIVRDGIAILLEGASGAGKSTLAYAARRFGFAPMCDEAVYVQLRPRLRVWSRRARVHLRPEARAHFPELLGLAETELPGDKRRLVIPPVGEVPRYADRVGICLLRRGPHARLERVTPERVASELGERVEPGFDLYAETLAERARGVAKSGAWALTLGADPHEAAALLDGVAAELSRAA